MLKDNQQKLFDAFYESTHANEYLDTKTELLIGLASAIALNCYPCMKYYLMKAKENKIKKEEISEVMAKVMAVSAAQKKIQAETVMQKFKIELSDYR